MKFELYLIEAVTNMHVGSGDINYNVIDNQVQKDAITDIPVIHSSSLKGAYREVAGEDSKYTSYIFGSHPNENDAHQNGAFIFFEAKMLSRPVRANDRAYYMATSKSVLEEFKEQIDNLNIKIDDTIRQDIDKLINITTNKGVAVVIDGNSDNNTYIETLNEPATLKNLNLSQDTISLIGKDIVVLSDEDFKKLPLPVIARNRLQNGESKNLWYEEIVPKRSRFYFAIGKPENVDEKDKKKIEQFEKRFGSNHLMQFGANKSIGYGYSKVTKVSK